MSIGPCDNCGLCCEELLVQADAVDVMREPRIEIERPLGKRDVHLSIIDACWIIAYPGRPCAFLKPDKRCDIYPTRPQGCVALVVGEKQCRDLRREHGLPPPAEYPIVHSILKEIMRAVVAEGMEEPDGR